MFGLSWSNYFDDYPQVTLESDAGSAQYIAESFVALLGWTVALEDKKRKPFSKVFDTLGVQIDFNDAVELYFKVRNKPSRSAEFDTTFRDILAKNKLSPGEAASLRGRFQYAEAHTFGRVGRFAMAPISIRAVSSGANHLLTSDIIEALQWMSHWLRTAEPRKVLRSDGSPPILIFTDGAVEGPRHNVVTTGAVAFFPETDRLEFFGSIVEPSLLFEWNGGLDKQVIGQAELLPILQAKIAWSDRLEGKDVIMFVDNSSALHAVIKGFSNSPGSRDILKDMAVRDLARPSNVWLCRVPSVSNPADAPSRLEFETLLRTTNCVQVDAPVVSAFRASSE